MKIPGVNIINNNNNTDNSKNSLNSKNTVHSDSQNVRKTPREYSKNKDNLYIHTDSQNVRNTENSKNTVYLDNINLGEDFDLLTYNPKTLGILLNLLWVLRQRLSFRDTAWFLKQFNGVSAIIKQPLPAKDLYGILKDLDAKYVKIELKDVSERILHYLRIVDTATMRDLMDYTRQDRRVVADAIEILKKEEWVLKHGRNYRLIKKIEWKKKRGALGTPIPFKCPYFDDRAYFRYGDTILVGAKTGSGKTHVSMNMIKGFVEQGITPYYIATEGGGRHGVVANKLGIPDEAYFYEEIMAVQDMELPPDGVTIIDWLLPHDFAETHKIFQFFSAQLQKTQGFLIIFMQLKDFDDEWFAPNLVKMYPAFATRYILNKDRKGGKFIIDKIREARVEDAYDEIHCSFNWETKELIPASEQEQVQEIMEGFEGTITNT